MIYPTLFAAAALALCAASLRADEPATRPAKLPLIVAHRGVPSEAPENTMAAFRLAWQQGADALESDFRLTADGKIICIHDPDAKRTTGVDGKVAEMTFDALRALDAGAWKGAPGERLPTLAECVGTVPPGKLAFLEIKSGPETVPAFVAELKASGIPPAQVRVITFVDAVIPAFKEAMPGVPVYYLYEFKRQEGAWTETPDAVLARAVSLGADGLDLSFKPRTLAPITPAFVARIRAAGLGFHVWTVDDPAIARKAVELGADSITTNRAGALRAELAEGRTTSRPATRSSE